MTTTLSEDTLFARLGGSPAIDAAVDRFYPRVLADPRIAHYFDGIDMETQIRHQKRFLTFAFGGAPGYDGRSLRAAHQGLVDKLGLGDEHFDAVVENLAAVLGELGVSGELIGEVALVAESVRDEVLCR
ncbi:MAG: group 1 truncated hemoglobin [Rhodocyclaceae bacterium]|nr:group 1 truncated hemoglobin [Rhodocyclaceae bacterium]